MSGLVDVEKAAAALTARQRTSDDPFERADAYLWRQLTADKACEIFLHVEAAHRTFTLADVTERFERRGRRGPAKIERRSRRLTTTRWV